MLYIGVDLGTSSIKLLLMEEDGHIRRIISREYPLLFPRTGWSEQNPEDWYQAFVSGMEELMQNQDASAVAGISFGGQMHGLVLLDDEDNVLRPCILWNDGRTEKECDYLNNVIGKDKLSEYTSNIAFTGFTAPKLLWVKKHEPEIFSKINKIMLPKDYLAYKLTRIHCTDFSDAAGMLLLDVKNKCWSKPMLEIIGVKEEQLPSLFQSYEVVGTLTEQAAKDLGLTKDTKVIAGAGDNAAGAVGTGTLDNGMCSISLGTSGTVLIASDTFAANDASAIHFFNHANGKYHFLGCMLSAASSNKWWMEDILATKDYTAEQKQIKNLGDNNVFFLPYLMGERTPHNDPNARGAFIGITLDTTREEMTQAVLEGVTYGLRDAVELARKSNILIERVRVLGGGAKSPLWCQMIADILNVKVDKINAEEGPGFGAAILAAVGCGRYATVETAAEQLIQVVETVEQNSQTVIKYEKKYQMFHELYPILKPVYKKMAE